ncbi:MAG: GvpL/GvpF family gas vesicle protein [Pseudomonadota bacterium]
MAEKEGNYIYCIIATNEERDFPVKAIGDREDRVYSICHKDIGAVISDSPVMKYPVSRKNTIAHQLVMEEIMKEYTILPVRFCTIAENSGAVSSKDRIKEKVLKARYDEFKALLAEMNNKAELGVKALWVDMDLIFEEVLNESKEIRVLKKKIASMTGTHEHNERIRLGGLVKSALERKSEKEANRILKTLKTLSADCKVNDTFSDRMLLNAAFLVDQAKGEKFDACVNELQDGADGRIKFKYVGPMPVLNFVEIVVKW